MDINTEIPIRRSRRHRCQTLYIKILRAQGVRIINASSASATDQMPLLVRKEGTEALRVEATLPPGLLFPALSFTQQLT